MPRRSAFESRSDYESDGGFIEDAPKSKKAKTIEKGKAERGKKRKIEVDEGEEEDGNIGAAKKKGKSHNKTDAGSGTKGKDGNAFWEISNTRRIGISEYKGKVMVDIREYYEKEGEMLPGKKGISLTLEQYNTVMSVLPEVESALAAKGAEVARPEFDGVAASKDEEVGGEEDEERVDDEDEDDDGDD
ncbi:MAG: hypothetical protein Q9164_007711 [Protoblastenia rupestris]